MDFISVLIYPLEFCWDWVSMVCVLVWLLCRWWYPVTFLLTTLESGSYTIEKQYS